MKTILTIVLLSFTGLPVASAQTKTTLYDPTADAQQAINKAVIRARKEHKNVLLQVGGNWCIWCTRFHNFVESNDTLKRLQDNNYVSVHVNHSPENKNAKVLAGLGYPQRFGFPVFVILDDKGNRLHTQNSAYLESGKGYDSAKVGGFFQQWSPAALSPAAYEE